MRAIMRTLAMIIGIVGAIVALIVNIVYSGYHDLFRLAGTNLGNTHGFIGLGLFVVGLIGALIAIPWPRTAALLMLISALGFIYVVHLGALIASPLLLIAALLAFLDRKKVAASAA